MTQLVSTQKKLPSINDLYEDKELVVKQNELNVILNSDPSPTWIKEHPFIKWLKYLPIERVEYLLTAIFSRWEVEVKEIKLIANSVVVTVSLKVQDPLDQNVWIRQDGIGAMPIQVQKWNGATEFDKMNSSAIQMWAPSAESYAIKDAAEKLGKIFWKDLNRKDTIGYIDRLTSSIEMMNKTQIIESIENTQTKDDLEKVWIHLLQKERDDEVINRAYINKKSSYENL